MASSDNLKNAHFRHAPLDENARQLRLLKINNHCPNCLLHFSLTTVSLDNEPTPTFTALSYEWGSGATEYEIIVNDSPFKIRKNLYDFLRKCPRITNAAMGEAWFIDAICTYLGRTSIKDPRNPRSLIYHLEELF